MNIIEKIKAAELLRAESLDLSGFGLQEIPELVYELDWLKELDISNNSLKRLPSLLKRLKKLEVLKASSNQFQSIPNAITSLFRLKKLYIDNNEISTISTDISDLSELVLLDLNYNKLNEFPTSLTQLPALEILKISNNSLRSLPDSISFLKRLKTLDLSFNQLQELPESITKIDDLNQLQLHGNSLTNPPIEIANQGLEAIAHYFKALAEKEERKSGKHYLLMIAIDRYSDLLQLNNSVKAARDLTEVLHQRFLFEKENTVTLYDEQATRRKILEAFENISEKLTTEDNLIIFFSGHGLAVTRSREYWIPFQGDIDEIRTLISLREIVYQISTIRAKHILLINDSVISASLIQRTRSVGGERDDSIRSRWVLSSGREEIGPDGPVGNLTPFMRVLINLLRTTTSDLWISDLSRTILQLTENRSKQLVFGNALYGTGDDGGEFLLKLKTEADVRIEVDYAAQEKQKDISGKQQDTAFVKRLANLDLNELKNQLKRSLAYDLEQSIGILQEIIKTNSKYFYHVILLSSRYQSTRDSILSGTISDSHSNVELNQIRAAVLKVIGELTQGDIDFHKLANFEQLKSALKGNQKSDQELWEEASLIDTVEAYKTYLRDSKEKYFQTDANLKIRELEQAEQIKIAKEENEFWNEKRREDSIEGYTSYLESYPEGGFAEEARLYIQEIKEAEEKLWALTENQATVAAFKAYLTSTKTSKYRALATERIQSLELATGKVNVYEAKLILVGNGRVGKTSISRRFLGEEFNAKEPSTHGIRIKKWIMPVSDKIDLKLNIWDFGGQEIYHATHRFFLTTRALYLLIWDKASNDDALENPEKEENFRFEYWLENIKTLSSNSPVIMVQNKIDEGKDYIAQPRTLVETFNVKEFCDVSAADNKDLSALKTSIKDEFTKGEELKTVIGYKLPQTWVNVRKIIEGLAEEKPYLTYTEFLAICKAEGVEEDSAAVLSKFLHEIGVILHFNDSEILYEIVILNPLWATNVIYKILNKQVEENNGIFTAEDLDTFWDQVITENKVVTHLDKRQEKRIFLELMKKFEICFELSNVEPRSYVVPQFLPPLDQKLDWNQHNNLRVGFKYNFLHKHIFLRLMVKLSERLNKDHYWRDTMLINFEKIKALIAINKKEQLIDIKIGGSNSLYQRFLLDTIIRPRLKRVQEPLTSTEVIPCKCGGYLTRSFIEEHLKKGITETLCSNKDCREKIALDKLWIAQEILQEEQQNLSNSKMVKLFISYAHKDESYKDSLVEHLSGMQRNGIIDGWQDRQILPGEEWDDEIKKELEAAQIIVFLVSSSFMASDYIHDVEIAKAIQRHEKGEVEIVPVIIRPCDFSSLKISKFQALPKDAKPIAKWELPDEAYLDVVLRLKHLIIRKYN